MFIVSCLLYQIDIMTLKNQMKLIKLLIRFTLSQSQKKSIIQHGIATIEAIIKMSTTFLQVTFLNLVF